MLRKPKPKFRSEKVIHYTWRSHTKSLCWYVKGNNRGKTRKTTSDQQHGVCAEKSMNERTNQSWAILLLLLVAVVLVSRFVLLMKLIWKVMSMLCMSSFYMESSKLNRATIVRSTAAFHNNWRRRRRTKRLDANIRLLLLPRRGKRERERKATQALTLSVCRHCQVWKVEKKEEDGNVCKAGRSAAASVSVLETRPPDY